MGKSLLSLMFLICLFSGFSQEKITISGLVKDRASGEPLIGANITGNNGTGATTDSYGFYSLQVFIDEPVTLKVSFVGYKPFQKEIKSKKNLRYDVYLDPGIDIDEVTVKAQKHVEEQIEIGMVELPVQQVKNIPIFGEPDVLKTMQLLPGVQGGSDGRSGLYVRGGSPDQNLFMLDGTSLYYVNHLGGFVSVFHPDILKNIKLYKGGFPARYGGRLSSVVDLRMKEGNKKELHGSYGIGLISGDITLEGPIKPDVTSFIVSVRRVWIDLILRPITKMAFQNASMGYNFYDFFGKVSHEADPFNRFYFSLYSGDDKLGYYYKMREDKTRSNAKYIWGNVLSTFRWNHIYNSKLNSDFTLYYTRYRYKNNLFFKADDVKGQNLYTTSIQDFGLKADYNWYVADPLRLRFGGGLSGNWFTPGQISYTHEDENVKTDTIIGGMNRTRALNSFVYIENEITPFRWWTINIGARFVNFRVEGTDHLSVEPRALSNLNLGKFGSIKAGYANMMQPVHMLTYSGSAFPTDIWLPSTPEIPPGLSTQYSLGYSKSFNHGRFELNVEFYKKNMKQLITVKGGVPLVNTNAWENNVERQGIGNSKGIELFLHKKQGTTTGWLSYTLSKSERQFANIDKGQPYPFKYDRRHDFSVVVNQHLTKEIDFSATWLYGSGYPTTLHNGVYQAIQPVNGNIDSPNSELFEIGYSQAHLYPGKNWLRMRDYHRLDLGINFRKSNKGRKGQNVERTWTIGIYNAYNHQNAVFYYYDYKNHDSSNPVVLYQQSGFPFIPSVKYSVIF